MQTTALRLTRTSAVAAAVLTTAVLAAVPSAASAKGCTITASSGRKLGPTYVTSLSVSGTSCSSGTKVVKAYHSCRKAHGGIAKGTCHSSVRGYRCSQKVTNHIATQYIAKVSCSKGRARVVHTYEQNT